MKAKQNIIWRFGKEGFGKRSTIERYQAEEQLELEVTHIDGNLAWLKSYGLVSWAKEQRT